MAIGFMSSALVLVVANKSEADKITLLRISFMADGMLSREIAQSPYLSNTSCPI